MLLCCEEWSLSGSSAMATLWMTAPFLSMITKDSRASTEIREHSFICDSPSGPKAPTMSLSYPVRANADGSFEMGCENDSALHMRTAEHWTTGYLLSATTSLHTAKTFVTSFRLWSRRGLEQQSNELLLELMREEIRT